MIVFFILVVNGFSSPIIIMLPFSLLSKAYKNNWPITQDKQAYWPAIF